jgi:hypothetical protein
MSDEEEFITRLRKLRGLVGEVYPVIVDAEGNIIDGWHRVKVDPSWHKKIVECKDMGEKALVWFAAHERRTVSQKELSTNMIHVAEKLLRQGIQRDQIVAKIAELTGYTEQYIRKFLPAQYKAKEKARAKPIKLVYPEEKPKLAGEKPAERRMPTKYLCPICGSPLALFGELLIPYHEALRK